MLKTYSMDYIEGDVYDYKDWVWLKLFLLKPHFFENLYIILTLA